MLMGGGTLEDPDGNGPNLRDSIDFFSRINAINDSYQGADRLTRPRKYSEFPL